MNQTFTWVAVFLQREPKWQTVMEMPILDAVISLCWHLLLWKSPVLGTVPFGLMQKGHSYLLGGSWAGSESMNSWQRHNMCYMIHFLLTRKMVWVEKGLAKMRGRGGGGRRGNKLMVSTLCFSLEVQTCYVHLPRLPWLLEKRLHNK